MKGLFKGAVLSAFVAMTGFGGYQLMSQSLEVDYVSDAFATAASDNQNIDTICANSATQAFVDSYTVTQTESASVRGTAGTVFTTGVTIVGTAVNGLGVSSGTVLANFAGTTGAAGTVDTVWNPLEVSAGVSGGAKLSNAACSDSTKTAVKMSGPDTDTTDVDTSNNLSINTPGSTAFDSTKVIDVVASGTNAQLYGDTSQTTSNFGGGPYGAWKTDIADGNKNGEILDLADVVYALRNAVISDTSSGATASAIMAAFKVDNIP